MKKVLDIFSCLIVLVFMRSVSAAESDMNNTHIYSKVIIEQVKTLSKSENATANNIEISEKTRKTPGDLYKETGSKASLIPFKPGKLIWAITENLPLTESECNTNYADPCNAIKYDIYEGSCFKPCIAYGPEFIDYDEAGGLVYFSASSASMGNAGGPYFFFVGDVKTKSIKYIGSELGPIDGKLSPGGRYLMLYNAGPIFIYDNIKGKLFTAVAYRDEKTDYEHHLTDIQWVANDRFTYNDLVPKLNNQVSKKTYTLAQ